MNIPIPQPTLKRKHPLFLEQAIITLELAEAANDSNRHIFVCVQR